ncbi:hypothetical protein Ancab_019632, partial [Ancistrocladus abbreviatus]
MRFLRVCSSGGARVQSRPCQCRFSFTSFSTGVSYPTVHCCRCSIGGIAAIRRPLLLLRLLSGK